MSETPPPGRSGTEAGLRAYLTANIGKFTDEALRKAARDAGYSDAAIDAAMREIRTRESSAPVRARARQIVLGLYAVTFALLVVGMAVNNVSALVIGAVILAISLGLALAISLWVVRRSTGHGADSTAMVLTGMLAVPVVLLVIVAGLCVATGLPLHSAPVL